MNKFILSLVTVSVLSNSLFAGNDDLLKYDTPNGWWWYETKVIDEKTNEEKIVKVPIKANEKMQMDEQKKTNELLSKLIDEQKKTNEINERIAGRLEYAFPNVTPIYTTNQKTGEKCLTNSSMDCFVMPVIAEGQQVPVLKDFIREPSPEHSKKWLQWQATYFNHLNKVSHGLRFAYLKYGAEAYPTQTTFAKGDSLEFSQAENALAHREAKIIDSLKDNIALMVFIGKNSLFERANNVQEHINTWNTSFIKNIDKVFVFDSEVSQKEFMNYMKNRATQRGDKEILAFWDSAKMTVRKDLYEKHKITMTPSIVMFYEDKKANINLSQVIVSGSLSSEVLRTQMKNFLTYNTIVEEKAFASEENWESPETKYQNNIPSPKNDKIYLDGGTTK